MKTIGEKLKEQLEIRGISQRELERLSGVPNSLINMLIQEKRTEVMTDTIKKLAKALGIHPAYFLDDDSKSKKLGPEYMLPHMTDEQKDFVKQTNNLPWISLSKEAAEKGLSPESVKRVISTILELYGDK